MRKSTEKFLRLREWVSKTSRHVLAITLLEECLLIYLLFHSNSIMSHSDLIVEQVFWIQVSIFIAIVCTWLQFQTQSRWMFRLHFIVSVQIILFLKLILSPPVSFYFEVIFLLYIVMIPHYDSRPSSYIAGISVLVEWLILVPAKSDALELAFISALLFITSELMNDFRERYIDLAMENNRLGKTIDQMDRVNREYQDNLIKLESQSTERERNRITRDIHDIVGYALTNNIMLLEMATTVLNDDILKTFGILERAKMTARESLTQVRDTLYTLRSRPIQQKKGIQSIAQTANMFMSISGINIKMNASGVKMDLDRSGDKLVQHLIKEALLNSFRHGRASEVTITITQQQKKITIIIEDNGVGVQNLVEGIGLKGTRERLEKFGGGLVAGNSVSGFILETYFFSGD